MPPILRPRLLCIQGQIVVAHVLPQCFSNAMGRVGVQLNLSEGPTKHSIDLRRIGIWVARQGVVAKLAIDQPLFRLGKERILGPKELVIAQERHPFSEIR